MAFPRDAAECRGIAPKEPYAHATLPAKACPRGKALERGRQLVDNWHSPARWLAHPGCPLGKGCVLDRLEIIGDVRLEGTVQVAGAKNAALPLLAAGLLSGQSLTLSNVPDVADVHTMAALLRGLGAEVREGPPGVLAISSGSLTNTEATYDIVRKMRASFLVLGPLVARLGEAHISLPGGCAIGTRPVDFHLAAIERLGARVDISGGVIHVDASRGLTGTRVVLPLPSVGATHTAMMAATGAAGETQIVNCARDPEVVDLAHCLNAMGAKIEGAGTHSILVQGGNSWRDARHEIIPDRIEAGTYLMAAAITGGRIEVTGGRLEHLAAVCQVLDEVGVTIFPSDRGLVASRDGPLRSVDLATEAFPGFPTDLQAQYMALMCVADGTAIIREGIFENRFMHVPELLRFGADIRHRGATAIVRGVKRLEGARVMATDLRASACLVLAGLAAKGRTTISRVYHLDRGYEDMERKLKRCGAQIERVSEP